MGVVNHEAQYSLPAAADLSTKQFYLVKITSTGMNLAGDGEKCFPLTNAPKAGEQARFTRRHGVTEKAIVGATISAGGIELASDLNGKLIPAATGDHIIGISYAAAAVGDITTFEFGYFGIK